MCNGFSGAGDASINSNTFGLRRSYAGDCESLSSNYKGVAQCGIQMDGGVITNGTVSNYRTSERSGCIR
jgi:hypothetical protein